MTVMRSYQHAQHPQHFLMAFRFPPTPQARVLLVTASLPSRLLSLASRCHHFYYAGKGLHSISTIILILLLPQQFSLHALTVLFFEHTFASKPRPEILNAKPQTLNAKPRTQSPKPQALDLTPLRLSSRSVPAALREKGRRPA